LILVVVHNVNLAYPLPTVPNAVATITAVVMRLIGICHIVDELRDRLTDSNEIDCMVVWRTLCAFKRFNYDLWNTCNESSGRTHHR